MSVQPADQPNPYPEARALRTASERLAAQFPRTQIERILDLMDDAYRETATARVQQFRVLLAEREVRRRLTDGAEGGS
jgi:hypothetical protein